MSAAENVRNCAQTPIFDTRHGRWRNGRGGWMCGVCARRKADSTEKAKELAHIGHVVRNGAGFNVTSITGENVYHVTRDGCSCLAAQYRPKTPCKHWRAVRMAQGGNDGDE